MDVKTLLGKVRAEYGRFRRRRRAAAELKSLRRDLAAVLRRGPRMGVEVTGGMGDYIVIARFLRDLAAEVGPLEFDIYASNAAIAKWVFAGLPGVGGIHEIFYAWKRLKESYPVVLKTQQLLHVRRSGPIADRWMRENPALDAVFGRIERFAAAHLPLIEEHPHRDNEVGKLLVANGWTRRDALHGIAGIAYGGDTFEVGADPGIFARTGLAPGSYVTISNGFDANFAGGLERSTKVYPHYAALVALTKQAHPDLVIVQIGASTSEPLAGVDVQLVSATTLKEAAALLGAARLHIDNEGGLVHLASCFGTRSCVLFGPTSVGYFSYPDNVNVGPGACGDCWWLKKDWMARCVRGLDVPECLDTIPPERVLRAIEPYLAARIPIEAKPGRHGEAA